MKPLKLSLRFWILISSIFSFLVGWGMFSHAGKPTPFAMFTSQNTDTTASSDNSASTQTFPGFTALPTLQPIPSLDSLVSGASTGSAANLSVGQFNVQPVQIPSTNSNNNSTAQLPTRRFHTKAS